MQAPTIFISTGEASGDAYGAALLREIRAQAGSAQPGFHALGGSKLRAAGAEIVTDSSRWGAIGIVQGLRLVPRVLAGYYRAKRRLRALPPGLFLPIDFGYANIRLSRHAKRLGWKVLYFVPPGSWRRDRQGRDLPLVTDEIVSPFPWSAEMLRSMGASAHFFGHPLKALRALNPPAEPAVRRGIAVLPGSRRHEIEQNVPVIGQALADHPEPVEFAIAAPEDVETVKALWRRHAPSRSGDTFTLGDTSGVLIRARAGIVCSGTATLEAALSRCPMVVVYRLTHGMVLEAKLLGVRPKFVSQPNILLDCAAVPELLHLDANPRRIRTELDALLEDGPVRNAQLQSFQELDAMLGPADALRDTASLALRMLSAGSPHAL